MTVLLQSGLDTSRSSPMASATKTSKRAFAWRRQATAARSFSTGKKF